MILCRHCHGPVDDAELTPCPFDPEHCRLCPTCAVHAAADFGPLGYPKETTGG